MFIWVCVDYFQKDPSNRMHYWCPKVASSITFTMPHAAGPSLGGIRPVLPPVKNVACKCVALPCSYPVASPYFRVLNLCAVQNISKVSRIKIQSKVNIPSPVKHNPSSTKRTKNSKPNTIKIKIGSFIRETVCKIPLR